MLRFCKGWSLQSLSFLFQIPDLRVMGSFVSPTVLIIDKIWGEKVLNLCFSHIMRWEILGKPKKHFQCTGIWSLWNLAVSLWLFLLNFTVFSCIVLSLCFSFLITQMALKANQWIPAFFGSAKNKWKFTLKKNLRLEMNPFKI